MHPRHRQAQAVRGWDRYLNAGIYFFFILFVVLLPYSTKGSRYAWMAAFLLWVVALFVTRTRLKEQPLALPMLAYVVFSGISTFLSPDPYLSWPHMKLVCWTVLIGTLFAQNLKRLSQVRTLIILLLLSATSLAGFTAWQYWHGIGLQVVTLNSASPLYQAGIRSDDILTAVNGHSVRSTADVARALAGVGKDKATELRFLRSMPLRRQRTFIAADTLAASIASASEVTFCLGRPDRAQGTLRHPMEMAELLVPITCLAWALMLGSSVKKRSGRIFFALIFVALTAAIFATQTRAALTGLLVGCVIALLVMGTRRSKVWLVLLLLALGLAGVLWVHHERGLNWIDPSDPGTRYRLIMWQDGIRLALHHPLFGVGMETIQNHWTEWNLRGFAEYKKFWHFHSDFVQLAAERGLLTLAAWLWFVVAYLMYLSRLLTRMRARSQFGWAITTGILAGFVGFLFVSLVQYTLGDDPIVMFLFFGFGTVAAMERMLQDPSALDVS